MRPSVRPLQVQLLETRLAPAIGSVAATVIQDFQDPSDQINDMVVLPNGQIITVGIIGSNWSINRFNADFTLDTTFGTKGTTILDSKANIGPEGAAAVAVDSQGRIVVGGVTAFTAGGDAAVARLTPEGKLDPSFLTNQGSFFVAEYITGELGSTVTDLLVQPDGKIVIVGQTATATNGGQWGAVRLLSNGGFDGSFNGTGQFVFNFGTPTGGGDFPSKMALQPDGKIVVVGTVTQNPDTNMAVARLTANGTPDNTFGFQNSGASVLGGAGNESATDVLLQTDGKIVLSYNSVTGNNFLGKVGFFRVATNGQVDTFSLLTLPTPGAESGTGMVAQSDGNIVLVGTSNAATFDFFAIRVKGVDLTLDTTFNKTGFQRADFKGQADIANDVALDLNGNLILGGSTSTSANPSKSDYAFARIIAQPPTAPVITGIADDNGDSPNDGITSDNTLTINGTSQGGVTINVGLAGVPAALGSAKADATGQWSIAVPTAFADGNYSLVAIAVDSTGTSSALSTTFAVTVNAPVVGQSSAVQYGVAAGPGGNGSVQIYDAAGNVVGTPIPAFPGFTGGVRTAVADVNGDGTPDLIAGTGPGRATEVKIFDGKTGAELKSINPFEAAFTGGVYVAAGDINQDGFADFVITPDEGGGPRARVFDGKTFAQLADFFGIDDPNFRGGARASLGDMNDDNIADLIVVAGFGGGPRVAGFNGTSVASGSATPVKLFNDFFALEESLRNGIFVAVGDVNGDGNADLIAGGGPGGGPRVFVVSGKELLASQGTNLVPAGNFFAGNPSNRGGVRVTVKDLDGDSKADIVTGAGTGAGSQVTRYLGKDISPTTTPPVNGTPFEAYPGFGNGVFVG